MGWCGLVLCAQVLAPEFAFAAPPVRVADRVVVEKAAHRLTLYRGSEALKTYRVALGPHPAGPKQRQGDGRTPEGVYTVDARNERSAFHRSLHISYPNDLDRARAAALGVDPGGAIMIHGLRNGVGWIGPVHRYLDWTKGCIAVTDAEIDEIWQSVPLGTAVEIRP